MRGTTLGYGVARTPVLRKGRSEPWRGCRRPGSESAVVPQTEYGFDPAGVLHLSHDGDDVYFTEYPGIYLGDFCNSVNAVDKSERICYN